MAEAQTVIASMGQQLAQALVDKTIAQVELAETREQLAAALLAAGVVMEPAEESEG